MSVSINVRIQKGVENVYINIITPLPLTQSLSPKGRGRLVVEVEGLLTLIWHISIITLAQKSPPALLLRQAQDGEPRRTIFQRGE